MSLAGAIAILVALIAATGALAYLQLRHMPLAASAALVVWLGDVFAPFLPRLGSGHIAFAPVLKPLLAVCLLLVYDRIARAASAGGAREVAVRSAIGAVAKSALPFSVAFGLALVPVFYASRLAPEIAAAALPMLAYASVTFGAAWLPLLFPYTESFAVRANRARERREHLAARLTALVQTRWAFSIAGTALVLAVIAGFGARELAADPAARLAWFLPGAAVLVLAAAAIVMRDWRMGLAFTLTLALAAAWMLAFPKSRVLGVQPFQDSVALATAAASLSGVAVEWSRLLRRGDELLGALAQALQREGPSAAFVGLFLALRWAILAASGFAVPLDLAMVLAIFGGLAVFPALGVAVHTLLPRYRSVDEVFGKR